LTSREDIGSAMARSRAIARAAAPFAVVDGVRVERGGKHGYKHVRGGQGRAKNMYQGVTPQKRNRTSLYTTPQEAAVAFAKRLFVAARQASAEAPQAAAMLAIAPRSAACSASWPMPVARTAQERGVVPLPVVRGVLLTREQAGMAAARGVALSLAE
jgi:hypothetical protein